MAGNALIHAPLGTATPHAVPAGRGGGRPMTGTPPRWRQLTDADEHGASHHLMVHLHDFDQGHFPNGAMRPGGRMACASICLGFVEFVAERNYLPFGNELEALFDRGAHTHARVTAKLGLGESRV